MYTSQTTYITMKLMLVYVFVFSLVALTLLATKIPKQEQKDALAWHDDPSSYHGAAMKRGLTSGLCNCAFLTKT